MQTAKKCIQYFDIDSHSRHISIIAQGNNLFDQSQENPKTLLIFKPHCHYETEDEIHTLTISNKWVPSSIGSQNAVHFFRILFFQFFIIVMNSADNISMNNFIEEVRIIFELFDDLKH